MQERGELFVGAVSQAAELDTSDWFESRIPPAAQQPESINLRASDEDPATQEAHAGLPPDDGPPEIPAPPTRPTP